MAKTVSRENVRPMGLDLPAESAEPRESSAGAPAAVAQDAAAVDSNGRPYCARHNCAMVASGGSDVATYYRCQVAGCGEKAKRLRGVVPRSPTLCPQRLCQADGGPPALEVVPGRSNHAQLVMQCPRCGFETLVPRPGVRFAPPRAADDDLSAR